MQSMEKFVSLIDRVIDDRISLNASYVGRNQSEFQQDADWEYDTWRVVLRRGKKSLVTEFNLGMSYYGQPPTTVQVLSSLLADASYVIDDGSFEEFCGDCGYDTDSRKAERMYKAVAEQTERLKKFLGRKFEAYMWETKTE